MGYDIETQFPYDPQEYSYVEDRLKRMAGELDDIREDVVTRIMAINPEDPKEFAAYFQASTKVVQAMFRRKWAREILELLEKKEADEENPVSVNHHGHSVREDDVPWLFFFLEVQRRGFVKALVTNPRQGMALTYAGLVNVEALNAMTVFVDDFVQIAPSLKTIDLGKDDPMRNVI